MIKMFQEWYDNRHEYAKNWKEGRRGKVAGLILGNANGWEYGVSNTVGWIDTIRGASRLPEKGDCQGPVDGDDRQFEKGRRGHHLHLRQLARLGSPSVL